MSTQAAMAAVGRATNIASVNRLEPGWGLPQGRLVGRLWAAVQLRWLSAPLRTLPPRHALC